MKTIIFAISAFIILMMTVEKGFSQDTAAYNVMKKYDEQSTFDNETSNMTMVLLNKQGDKRVREIVRYLVNDKNDKRSYLIKFLSPADVKGTGFLVIENVGRADDQWLYLPAFNKSKRISASEETDYFVGSDFTYEDLSREKISEFNYEFLSETMVDGHLCYQIKATPKTENKIKESGYSKRELFIRKDNFVLVKANLYDKSGALSKIFNTDNVKQVEGTRKWRAFTFGMTNVKNSHKTIIGISKLEVNKALSKDLFTLKYLEEK